MEEHPLDVAVRDAEEGNPHTIYRHGEPVAVIVGAEQYQRMLDSIRASNHSIGD